jgi:drug/metabolite transporter (DMT)-like permease
MDHRANASLTPTPARWSVVLAFALVYSSWGTTYLAIKKGVEVFPPALFGGARIALAGLILLTYLVLCRQSLRMPWKDFLWTALVGVLFFVGGNGLITVGEKFVASSFASVLVASTPLWMALWEMLWPWGERLRLRGWLGLAFGMGGVLLLLAPRLQRPDAFIQDAGPLLVLGSALTWSLGSCILRHRRVRGDHLSVAAYQMLVGGCGLLLIGLLVGEKRALDWQRVTPQAGYAFLHLLVFGSLIGFVAYNWLLGQVSTTMAGTYAYVNPLVAVLVGWLLNGEPLTGGIVAGMAVILVGVALVRGGGVRGRCTGRGTLETCSTGKVPAYTPNSQQATPAAIAQLKSAEKEGVISSVERVSRHVP